MAARSQAEYTATGAMSISRHARAIRTAISPRLAIRTFFTSLIVAWLPWRFARSQRNIAVFFGGILDPLVLEIPERRHELAPCLARPNHFVEKTAASGDIWIGKLLPEFSDLLRARPCG